MQLAATDVYGIDPPRAACEQHVGEASGRGADIEADAAARIEHGIEAKVTPARPRIFTPPRDT